MVQHGNFLLELIRASSQTAFPSHIHPRTNQTYYEVEPGEEYYIRVAPLPSVPRTRKSLEKVTIRVSCDSVDLGYYKTLFPSNTNNVARQIMGIRSVTNNIRTLKALKFATINNQGRNLLRSSEAGDGDVSSSFVTVGAICARYYECICEKKAERNHDRNHDRKDQWNEKESGGVECISATSQSSRKSLRSTAGDICQTESWKGRRLKHRGRQLASITVKYCSAAGLIQEGIFSAPTASCNYVSAREKRKRESSRDDARKIRIEGTNETIVSKSTVRETVNEDGGIQKTICIQRYKLIDVDGTNHHMSEGTNENVPTANSVIETVNEDGKLKKVVATNHCELIDLTDD